MAIVSIRLCDLCYDIGKYKDAIAEYTDKLGEQHDICADCKVIVVEAGLLTRDLSPEDDIVTVADIKADKEASFG